jgi:hypothetical protein
MPDKRRESTIAKQKEVIEVYEKVIREHGELSKHIDRRRLYLEVSQMMNDRYSENSIKVVICNYLKNGKNRRNNKGE